jgi:O-antigen biosynthesis protein
MKSPITFCIGTYNNLNYLEIAVDSVRRNSYFEDAPFIIHAENCTDGTNEWLEKNKETYNLTPIIEPNNIEVKGIGGSMNECASHVETKYIMFLHSDFYVTRNWDKVLYDLSQSKPDEKTWVNSHRIEPKMFENSESRPGTLIVHKDDFGAYHYDFDSDYFDGWSAQFSQLNDIIIPKGEGVSGLIRKKHWDEIGGNDPQFSPSSFEDMDLFLRMLQQGFKFYLTSQSIVWHFGARGSHRLEENNGKSSQRQIQSEQVNLKKYINKWGNPPSFDEWGMIKL